ncbi:hypothetical protein B0H12DRAFT_1166154 [Mycena haematopus]|nr:hypothetical protein B0H12DRAFT_1166154 [Mycena haematopus]
MPRAPKNDQSRQQAKYLKKALVSALFRAEHHHHSDDEDLASLRVARPHFDYDSLVYNTY